jgi:hypothetical protein
LHTSFLSPFVFSLLFFCCPIFFSLTKKPVAQPWRGNVPVFNRRERSERSIKERRRNAILLRFGQNHAKAAPDSTPAWGTDFTFLGSFETGDSAERQSPVDFQ